MAHLDDSDIRESGLGEFRAWVRDWFEEHTADGWRDWFDQATEDEQHEFLLTSAAAARAPGFLAPHWPREFGGGGFTVAQQMVVKQEMFRSGYPPVGGGVAFRHAAATLIQYGTPDQQAHLFNILEGEPWCQGFSEPNAGSDLASLQTRAVRDGENYVINGQKTWSSGATRAAWCLLLARTNPEVPKRKGLSMFMLDMSLPGIEIRPIRQATGSSEFAELFLTDVVVPAACRLGPENEGWKIANTTLNTERGSYIVENHSALEQALSELCSEAADTSVGEGRTAIEDPAIRLEIADCAAEIEVLGILAEKIVGDTIGSGEIGPEASIVKLFYSEALQRFTELAMRVRGLSSALEPQQEATGWTTGEWMRDHIGSWVWTIAAGSSEIQRNIISEKMLGLPREQVLN